MCRREVSAVASLCKVFKFMVINLALINIYNTMLEKTNEFNNPYSSLPPGRKNDQGKYENGSKTCQKVSF